jgi:hypothetical protein
LHLHCGIGGAITGMVMFATARHSLSGEPVLDSTLPLY